MAFTLGLNPIAAVAGMIQPGIQGRQTRKNIKAQFTANRELAKYTYGQDLDMWNKMNQYNAPAQQMQRFKDAGLNPRLIYGKGSGGASAGQATQMPKYQQQNVDYMARQPMVDTTAIMSGLHGYQELQLKQKQEKLLDEQIYKTQQEGNSSFLDYILKQGRMQFGPSTTGFGVKIIDRETGKHMWTYGQGSQAWQKEMAELGRTQQQIRTDKAREFQTEQMGKLTGLGVKYFEIAKVASLLLGSGALFRGIGGVSKFGGAGKLKGISKRLLQQAQSLRKKKGY